MEGKEQELVVGETYRITYPGIFFGKRAELLAIDRRGSCRLKLLEPVVGMEATVNLGDTWVKPLQGRD